MYKNDFKVIKKYIEENCEAGRDPLDFAYTLGLNNGYGHRENEMENERVKDVNFIKDIAEDCIDDAFLGNDDGKSAINFLVDASIAIEETRNQIEELINNMVETFDEKLAELKSAVEKRAVELTIQKTKNALNTREVNA